MAINIKWGGQDYTAKPTTDGTAYQFYDSSGGVLPYFADTKSGEIKQKGGGVIGSFTGTPGSNTGTLQIGTANQGSWTNPNLTPTPSAPAPTTPAAPAAPSPSAPSYSNFIGNGGAFGSTKDWADWANTPGNLTSQNILSAIQNNPGLTKGMMVDAYNDATGNTHTTGWLDSVLGMNTLTGGTPADINWGGQTYKAHPDNNGNYVINTLDGQKTGYWFNGSDGKIYNQNGESIGYVAGDKVVMNDGSVGGWSPEDTSDPEWLNTINKIIGMTGKFDQTDLVDKILKSVSGYKASVDDYVTAAQDRNNSSARGAMKGTAQDILNNMASRNVLDSSMTENTMAKGMAEIASGLGRDNMAAEMQGAQMKSLEPQLLGQALQASQSNAQAQLIPYTLLLSALETFGPKYEQTIG